ncbi:FimV/HubP family polar landmark protein, partial [Vibrio nereis]|uniref:FimV/HubP family polar landmark protein n=1 Tax=Vibrio nereis TaxID=693 RepID=UPI0024946CA8
ADMASEPEAEPQAHTAESTESEESFSFDELELPEYSEEDALADMASEPEAEPQAHTAESTESEESFNFDELELPEYSEEDALADMASKPEAEPQAQTAESTKSEESFNFDELELPEYSEQDALAELFNSNYLEPELSAADPQQELDNTQDDTLSVDNALEDIDDSYPHAEFDEKAFDELLSESTDNESGFDFEQPIDATASDSAGLDIDAMLDMGGEDWNGFSLSPEQQAKISDDIPEEDQAIWSQGNPPAQATISNENWEDQKEIEGFNPRDHQYRTIDELMAEVEAEGEQEIDDTLQLDVGLNDFPDVIGDIDSYDDSSANTEAAGKLDLAKMYMEMNDPTGARKLLEEAIVDGSDEIRREAKNLIDSLVQS